VLLRYLYLWTFFFIIMLILLRARSMKSWNCFKFRVSFQLCIYRHSW
jgi:hypothetical protein